jgi:hypothetical protein
MRSSTDTWPASARFGELRSIAHGQPSEAAWTRLTALVRTLCAEGDEARSLWDDQLAPYLDAALDRWPARLRVASYLDLRSLSQERQGKPSPVISIARALQLFNLDAFYDIVDDPILSRIQHVSMIGVDRGRMEPMNLYMVFYARHLNNLRSLDLVHFPFGARFAYYLFRYRLRTARLTSLRMRGCQIGRQGGSVMRRADLSHIETLELMGCRIGMAGIRALAQSPDGPSPLHLRLDGLDMLCTEAWPALINSPRLLSRVESLEISSAPRRSAPRTPLPALLDRCPPLRRFEVSLLRYSAERLNVDLAHPNLAKLRALRTQLHPGRSGRNTAALLDAPFVPGLRELNLSDSPITDEDARIIAACDRLSCLESLRLDRCSRITAAGLDALLSSPHLSASVRAQLATQRIVEVPR